MRLRRESITQSACPSVQADEEGGSINKFYFSFPLDWQLLASEKAIQKDWPVMHYEVFSKDSWDRVYMHGCGYFSLPDQPGTHFVKTKTWRPNLSHDNQIS